MRLVGKIDNGFTEIISTFYSPCGNQASQIGHRATTGKNPASFFLWKTEHFQKPVHRSDLHRGSRRRCSPSSRENIKSRSQTIRHGADKITEAWNKRIRLWMRDYIAMRHHLIQDKV